MVTSKCSNFGYIHLGQPVSPGTPPANRRTVIEHRPRCQPSPRNSARFPPASGAPVLPWRLCEEDEQVTPWEC